MRIILASKSPRRREILTSLGLDFEIMTSDADENCDLFDTSELVRTLASRKGEAVRKMLAEKGESLEDTLIIASDTLVCTDREILGKPKDRDDARKMLKSLSGKSHFVKSGLYVFCCGRVASESQETEIVFDEISDTDIEKYLDTDEPYDKAGAYAIQGIASLFIRGIRGDYFNVVGLPVNLLFDLLKKEFDIDILDLKNQF